MAINKSRLSFVLKCFLLVGIIYQSTAESVLVKTQRALNGSGTQVALASSDGGEKDQVTPMNIAFDLPDLTVSVETPTGTAQLEAYKSVNNDKILQDSSGAKISQLFWVTVGLPSFIRTSNPRNSSEFKIFHFNNRGISTYLEMKTDAMGSALAEAARNKYRANISDYQVVHLILSQFECSTILYDADESKYVLKGRVADFRKFPLRMDFVAPLGSQERRLFEEELGEHEGDLEFDCNMESSGGKVIKTNTLSINANQIQQIGLEEKLFGPAGSNGKTDVYVSRNQMSELASEMYSALNIVEDYEMPEFQFKDAFVDGIISQISTIGFDLAPIDTVLASISKYGFDIGADIQPDVIKKDIGSILKIETTDSKSHIVLDEQRYRDYSTSQSHSGGFGASGFGVKVSANWANSNAQSSISDDRSLSDQLLELNKESKNEAQWDIEGDRVIPKSLNVARLTRAKMSKTLTFNRIRMQTFEAPFHRRFSLYTLAATAPATFLDQLSSLMAKLEETIKQLISGSTPFLDQLSSRVALLENTTKQAKLDSDKQSNQITTLRTDYSAFSANVNQRLANVDTRLGNLDTAIQSAQSSINSVSSTAVRQCRICFWETEGSSQCQKTRNSCSGWSRSPAWTLPFKDDTDHRGGGCTYQWLLECITY